MSYREIAVILYNMSLDMDYADAKGYGKESIDILENEIKWLHVEDQSLYYVLESIAEQNKNITIFIDGTEDY